MFSTKAVLAKVLKVIMQISNTNNKKSNKKKIYKRKT